MIKKIALAIVLPLIAMSFAACGAQEDEYVGVCVDPETQVRIDDDYCDPNDSDFMQTALIWYMLSNSSRSYPPVGGHVNRSYFKTTRPKGASVHYGLPKSGGSSVKSYSSKTSWGKSSTKSSWGSSGSKSSSSGSKSWGSSSKSGGFSSGSRSSGRR